MATPQLVESFDRKSFIDNHAEQELFLQLLKLRDPARLLVITDRGGRGKSHLLKRLEYICRWENDPPIPVSRVELDRVTHPFHLVQVIRADLRQHPFPRFDEISINLRIKNTAWFVAPSLHLPESLVGHAILSGATIHSGGVGAGVAVVNPTLPDWHAGIESHAQDLALAAFFTELKAVAAEQPVVFLLDAVDEKAPEAVREWVLETLIREQCLDTPDPPAKLVVVTAGRTPPLWCNVPRYAQSIRSITSLGEWDLEHVRAFLTLHGYGSLSDHEVELIHLKLKQKVSKHAAISLAELLAKMAQDV